MNKIIEYYLDNGVKVILTPNDSLVSTMIIGFNVGSYDENSKIAGVSHFLEHLMFKATKNYKTPEAIAVAFEMLGADQNAYTWTELTGYKVTSINDNIYKSCNVLFDMTKNPRFDESYIASERDVVLREIDIYKDDPSDFHNNLMIKSLHSNTVYGNPVIGYEKPLKTLTIKDIYSHYNKHYVSDNMVVSVAGGFDLQNMKRYIHSKFYEFERRVEKYDRDLIDFTQNKPMVKFGNNKQNQTLLSLLFRTVPDSCDDSYPLDFLSGIMGSGMASKMFIKIREKMGAAYRTVAYHNCYRDHGNLELYSSIDIDKFEDVIRAKIDIVNECKSGKITDNEMVRIKNLFIGNLTRSSQTTYSLAKNFARQYVLKRKIESFETMIEELMKITKEDVIRVANQYCNKDNANIVCVFPDDKPIPCEEDYLKLLDDLK